MCRRARRAPTERPFPIRSGVEQGVGREPNTVRGSDVQFSDVCEYPLDGLLFLFGHTRVRNKYQKQSSQGRWVVGVVSDLFARCCVASPRVCVDGEVTE